MDESLNELYQAIILDHNKHPHNCRVIEPCTHHAEGYNPLCGDEITIYVCVEAGKILDVAFTGQGCAISRASASLMTERLRGKTLVEAHREWTAIQQLLKGEPMPQKTLDEMGDLAALAGVSQFPARIKCATLGWHTLEAALAGNKKASTE